MKEIFSNSTKDICNAPNHTQHLKLLKKFHKISDKNSYITRCLRKLFIVQARPNVHEIFAQNKEDFFVAACISGCTTMIGQNLMYLELIMYKLGRI